MGSNQSTDSNSGSFIERLTNRLDNSMPDDLFTSKKLFNNGEEADLPAECWVALLQYQSTVWLGKMSMTSKRWKSQVWTFASVVDTSYIVNQHAFDYIIDQIVDACTTTPGLVALRNLILVPKRLKLATASAILPRVNKLSCLKRLTFLLCSDIGWEQLALCTELLAEIPELSLHRCKTLVKLPALEQNLPKLKKIESLEIRLCEEVKTDHIKVVAETLPNLRALTLQGVDLSARCDQNLLEIVGNLSSLRRLEINQCFIDAAKFVAPDIKLLANFPLLETLDLRMGDNFSYELESLPFMPNLKELRVCGITTKDNSFDLGSKLPNLATLVITRRSPFTWGVLPEPINTLRSLRRLCVYYYNISTLNHTGDLSGITNLELVGCTSLPIAEWNSIDQSWAQLRRLRLDVLENNSLPLIVTWITKCASLNSLDIPYNSSDSPAFDFLANLPQLHKLCLRASQYQIPILYHFLEPLERSGARILSNLTSLTLNWDVTAFELESISKTFKNIQFLQMNVSTTPRADMLAPLLKLKHLIEVSLELKSWLHLGQLDFPHPTASINWINPN